MFVFSVRGLLGKGDYSKRGEEDDVSEFDEWFSIEQLSSTVERVSMIRVNRAFNPFICPRNWAH